jgi:nucleoside-diphosphate-sugar epimerase
MKVLLTGASGFVGSHILDSLRARGIPTALLLRPASNRRFLKEHLVAVEVRTGSITESASLAGAMSGITHVIHCAGCTRAVRQAEFDEINHIGTRNVVTALNGSSSVTRLVHISSLAVAGPATPANPARESHTPAPISVYGKSKLAGELEVRNLCRADYTVLRPPAVYGPRDDGFLSLFKAVKLHLLPRTNATQALSVVFVRDLAESVVKCLDLPGVVGKTYFVANREIVTGRLMAHEIAASMQRWTLPLPMPPVLLWPVCLFEQMRSRLTGKASLLGLQKFAELRAPGWVCDPGLFEKETGCHCTTTLKAGISEALGWYRHHGWI